MNELRPYPKALVAWYEKMADEAATLPAQQREELEQWEADSVNGESLGTSDWPGWEPLIGPRPRLSDF